LRDVVANKWLRDVVRDGLWKLAQSEEIPIRFE
jgi:hypothetical protein